jgi:hypothetical protein
MTGKQRAKWVLVALVVASPVVCCCVLDPFTTVRDTPGWSQSQIHLQTIAFALHNYASVYGKFPPPVVRDKDGRPLYSWRVAILSVTEENKLYREFKHDEPWDSPHNKTLLTKMPQFYRKAMWSDDPKTPGKTHYQVFVGPGAAFERDGLTPRDFPDGLADTLLVVEAAEPVPWSKPVDLEYDPDKPLPRLGGIHKKATFFFNRVVNTRDGFNAAFADASTRFIADDVSEATLRALITRNGGETVELSKTE